MARKSGNNLAVLFYSLIFFAAATLMIMQSKSITNDQVNKLHMLSLANFTSSKTMKILPRRNSPRVSKNTSTATTSHGTKPLFVMHVGVPKTASSTLQHTFELHADLLAQDNWYYAGKVLGENGPKNVQDYPIFSALSSATCRDQVNKAWKLYTKHNSTENFPTCWNSMLSFLNDLYQRRVNVLLSEENLCIAQLSTNPVHWSALQHALSQWDVKIIVAYRRWPEWVASGKNQLEKPTKAQRRRRIWPAEGGLPTLPLYPYFEDILRGKTPTYFPYADTVIKEYRKYFSNVEVVNYHKGDIVSEFVCQVLSSSHTCQETQQHNYTNHSKVNKQVDMQCDMLAVAAAEAGLVHLSLSRVQVAQTCRDFHQHNNETVPWILECPTKDQLQPILRRSLQLEQEIIPECCGAASKDEHVSSFWEAVEQKIFCSVDTAAMLRNPKWHRFFKELT
jgi:hypothetical protein